MGQQVLGAGKGGVKTLGQWVDRAPRALRVIQLAAMSPTCPVANWQVSARVRAFPGARPAKGVWGTGGRPVVWIWRGRMGSKEVWREPISRPPRRWR